MQPWTKKYCSQVGHCLARTIGSDMTNPQIPGRKWHTVESLRGLESHRTSGDVESTPEGEEVISQTGHTLWFLCKCPSGQLVALTAVQHVIQEVNSDGLRDMKRTHHADSDDRALHLSALCLIKTVWLSLPPWLLEYYVGPPHWFQAELSQQHLDGLQWNFVLLWSPGFSSSTTVKALISGFKWNMSTIIEKIVICIWYVYVPFKRN